MVMMLVNVIIITMTEVLIAQPAPSTMMLDYPQVCYQHRGC
jgi:hypothetical protein